MPALSDYHRAMLTDFLFREGDYVFTPTFYVALCKIVPTSSDTGDTLIEPSGNYVRQAITASASNWFSTQGTTGVISTGNVPMTGNTAPITWNSVSWSGVVKGFALCDSPTGGNVLWFASLKAYRTVVAGLDVVFAPNTLKIGFV